MRKVLIIHTGSFEPGGITSVIINYYTYINTHDLKIDFVTQNEMPEQYQRWMSSRGAQVYILQRKKHPLRYIGALYRIVKEGRYDVVHVHGNSATMFLDLFPAYLAGCKERIAHSHTSRCDHYILHKLLSPFFKHIYTKALACSQQAGQWIFGADNFEVLPNGVALETFYYSKETRLRVRRELHLEDKFVIGHVGFFNESKNLDKLFSVFAEVKKKTPQASLLCVTGSPQVPDKYLTLIKALHIENDVTILKQRSDVNALLQAMDVFVFPSRREGLGVAVLEAQASGLCCIVSENVPKEVDISPCIRHMSLRDSDEEWADAIISFRERQAGREQIGKQLLAERFDIKNCVRRLEEIYHGNGFRDCSDL